MTHWTDHVTYRLEHDCEMGKISGFDDKCQEHWILVEAGRGYADRRADALEKIQTSIERGDPPGKVPDE